jgi:hypothetical protein
VLKNPKPFITIELTPKGRMPNKFKFQLALDYGWFQITILPLSSMKKAVEVAKASI